MEKKFLEKEDLEKLKNIQGNIQQVVLELGQISLEEYQLNDRKKNTETKLDEISKSEQDFTNLLKEKYGNISLNLETGEYDLIG